MPEYQTFPFADWLEAQPPLLESGAVPPAGDLLQGAVWALPEMPLGAGPVPFYFAFTVPGVIVREVSGVRDGSELLRETAAAPAAGEYARVRFKVLVFNRSIRAGAWADMRATQMDLGRQQTLEGKYFRTTGPDAPYELWVERPGNAPYPSGHAVAIARRGPIGLEIDAVSEQQLAIDRTSELELSARAQRLAGRAAAGWLAWLQAQPYVVPGWRV